MISAFREPIPCVLVAVRPLAHASLTRLLDPLQTLKRPKELVVKIDLPRLVRVSVHPCLAMARCQRQRQRILTRTHCVGLPEIHQEG